MSFEIKWGGLAEKKNEGCVESVEEKFYLRECVQDYESCSRETFCLLYKITSCLKKNYFCWPRTFEYP